MTAILNVRHQRIDDIPLSIGLCDQLRLAGILSQTWAPMVCNKGCITVNWLLAGWRTFCREPITANRQFEEWTSDNSQTLGKLLEYRLREVEFSDDRLGRVLSRLSNDDAWAAIERELWASTVTIYESEQAGVRLGSTTSYGYHQPQEDGVMQYGGTVRIIGLIFPNRS